MNKHLAIKSITLFLSWLTLSPLLFIFDGRESAKDGISFSIDIERASKTFHIRVGEW